MVSVICEVCIFPLQEYLIGVCMSSLGLAGAFPKIVDRLCPQCNPIAEIIRKIYGS